MGWRKNILLTTYTLSKTKNNYKSYYKLIRLCIVTILYNMLVNKFRCLHLLMKGDYTIEQIFFYSSPNDKYHTYFILS